MGLSQKLFEKWRDNFIVLSGISSHTVDDNITLVEYSQYSMGKNIDTDTNLSIKVSEGTDRFVGITTVYNDTVRELFPRLVVIPKTSEYVLLALSIVASDKNNHKCLFGDATLPKAKHCVNNQISSTTPHFNSTGYCFSFGLHGVFKTNKNMTTVDNYSMKRNKTPDTMISYDQLLSDTVQSLQTGMTAIGKIMDNHAHRVINSCNTFLTKEMNKRHVIFVNTIKDKTYPFLSAHLNINVGVGTFHTEEDYCPTLVYFPVQKNGFSIYGEMNFLFRLSEGVVLRFLMSEGFGITYSALLLTHRQEKLLSDQGHDIVNVSAYTNKMTFTHFRTSINKGISGMK